MIILGAGMAGLLAGAMLRDKCTAILEAQSELPNNHSAVLRFRSSIVGDSLNIPFKQVKAVKAVHPWRNPIADALAYSQKTNGGYYLRSLISAKGELSDRWIAPNDFVQQMVGGLKAPIHLNAVVNEDYFSAHNKKTRTGFEEIPIISTLPMPSLMKFLKYDGATPEKFDFRSGQVVTATLDNCEAYCSLYVPDPEQNFYRISISGSQLIVEFSNEGEISVYEEIKKVKILMGLDCDVKNLQIKKMKYAKILPIDENIRKKFILWASEKHNVYSLGRFATWRPSLLLDDLVNDVRIIQKIASTNNYDQRKLS